MAEEEYSEDQESGDDLPVNKKNNTLPLWGNKETMNINSLILKNIKSSPYFKQDLYRLKTYHEVVDEIYYKVGHLEPWEKNSRKLASQIGHAGEEAACEIQVRGVSAGGIVSTPYCLLYKLFTLKLTRKQLKGLLDHADSPYIRGLGFMYIRYCQPPADLIEWYEPYFWDEEVIDLKAGGGFQTTVGEMCKMLLTKLDWFGTLFPRIPVVVENQVKKKMKQLKEEEEEYGEDYGTETNNKSSLQDFSGKLSDGEKYKGSESCERLTHSRSGDKRMSRSRSKDRRRSRSRSKDRRRSRSRSKDRRRSRSRSKDRRRSRSRSKDRRRSRSRSKDRRKNRSRSKDRRRSRSRSKDRRRSRSRSKDRRRSRSRSKDRRRSRSRSKDRRRNRSRSKDRRRSRSRSKDRRRSRSRSKDRRRSRSRSKDGRHTSSSYHRHSPASQQGGGRNSERKRQRSPDKRTKNRSRSSERHRHRSSSRERTRYRSSRERSRSRSRDRYKGSKY